MHDNNELIELINKVNEGRVAYRKILLRYRTKVSESSKQFPQIDSIFIKQMKMRRKIHE